MTQLMQWLLCSINSKSYLGVHNLPLLLTYENIRKSFQFNIYWVIPYNAISVSQYNTSFYVQSLLSVSNLPRKYQLCPLVGSTSIDRRR